MQKCLVAANQGPVGRNCGDVEPVDLTIFLNVADRGSGHAGQSVVAPEECLERDGCQGAGFLADGAAFLGLQCLMKPFIVAPPRHHPPGKLVDDDNRAVLHDVVTIALQQRMGAQRLYNVMQKRDRFDVVQRNLRFQQRSLPKRVLNGVITPIGQDDAAPVVNLVMIGLQCRYDRIDHLIEAGLIAERAKQRQRHARFVDQHGVGFIDQRKGVAALDCLG